MAEHRVAESRRVTLSRTTTRSRVIALVCVIALGLVAVPNSADAQSASQSLAATRAAIDDLANQWFAAQRRVNDLDLQIRTLSETLAPTEAKVERLRSIAGARAIELYESNSAGLGDVTNVMTADPLEVGRRAALIAQANEDDQVVIDELEAALGDLTARRDSLERAVRLFDEQGAPGWAAAARADLERVGARRPSSPGRLTATERRVADLAVRGLANKEIARTLVVTVSTVEFHLRNAYTKLGIRSRMELAPRLTELDDATT